jgi:hypothetical protein
MVSFVVFKGESCLLWADFSISNAADDANRAEIPSRTAKGGRTGKAGCGKILTRDTLVIGQPLARRQAAARPSLVMVFTTDGAKRLTKDAA